MAQADIKAKIEQSFEDLRSAVQEQRYQHVQEILRNQRPLFEALDFKLADAFDLLKQGQDLANWALTLTRVQRSHMERAYACLVRLQQWDNGYSANAVSSADLVDLRG